jgi:nicotinic acid mononucleotide adenylyltransferase
MLGEFGLLVADRGGRYEPPPDLAERIRRLPLPGDYSEISATEVRNRIRAGRPWEHLVPEPIVELVRTIYGKT